MFIAKVLRQLLKTDEAISTEGYFLSHYLRLQKGLCPRILFRYITSHILKMIYLKRRIEDSCVEA